MFNAIQRLLREFQQDQPSPDRLLWTPQNTGPSCEGLSLRLHKLFSHRTFLHQQFFRCSAASVFLCPVRLNMFELDQTRFRNRPEKKQRKT